MVTLVVQGEFGVTGTMWRSMGLSFIREDHRDSEDGDDPLAVGEADSRRAFQRGAKGH
jgi:hypothetical protein